MACQKAVWFQDVATASVGVAEHGVVDLDLLVLSVQVQSGHLSPSLPHWDWVVVVGQPTSRVHLGQVGPVELDK